MNHLNAWEKRFRSAAKSDGLALLRNHMEMLALPGETKLGLPGTPELTLEGTIQVIRAIAIYETLDGQSFDQFLNMQRYNPAESPESRYVLTFTLMEEAYGRVLVDSSLHPPDLADLFNHIYENYLCVGYDGFFVSHLDWSPLTAEEQKDLENKVNGDLFFDYSEDDLTTWFEPSDDGTYLYVGVQDRDAAEIEEFIGAGQSPVSASG